MIRRLPSPLDSTSLDELADLADQLRRGIGAHRLRLVVEIELLQTSDHFIFIPRRRQSLKVFHPFQRGCLVFISGFLQASKPGHEDHGYPAFDSGDDASNTSVHHED